MDKHRRSTSYLNSTLSTWTGCSGRKTLATRNVTLAPPRGDGPAHETAAARRPRGGNGKATCEWRSRLGGSGRVAMFDRLCAAGSPAKGRADTRVGSPRDNLLFLLILFLLLHLLSPLSFQGLTQSVLYRTCHRHANAQKAPDISARGGKSPIKRTTLNNSDNGFCIKRADKLRFSPHLFLNIDYLV